MSMFCFQCQETAKNNGCTVRGVCGKLDDTATLMDLLIYLTKGVGLAVEKAGYPEDAVMNAGHFASKAMFSTITNANFDQTRLSELINEAQNVRDKYMKQYSVDPGGIDALTYVENDQSKFVAKGSTIGVLSNSDEDARSLQQLLTYGIKGISAYAHHAAVLGYEEEDIYRFILEGLASTLKKLSIDEMTSMVLKAGDIAVKTMALLDKANRSTFGSPIITKVNIGVRKNPGILISGHDLLDLRELLDQTENTGLDIYTHSEMLPAHYYPMFRKYPHFAGNYGGSWWHQPAEFESFNGPILMTTNCIVPVKDSYKDRIFTTGMAGYPGVKHIPDRKTNVNKDFSEIIALAKKCMPPIEIEKGEIVGGFAHEQVLNLADKIVDAVKSGAIQRFVVMGGCDGRQKDREYFTDVAKTLPNNTIILTAGCAKYRYNKLDLGEIGGIPRVLDAGQCNDSYSLALIALKLKEVFGLDDVNKLPLSFDIAWYEQKAVAVLLALLALGFTNLRLGPTLPAFLSPNVAALLVEKFKLKKTSTAGEDVASMMKGE
jgi:hydroxylamine reductase